MGDILRRRPYPGQKWRHGWIPVRGLADILASGGDVAGEADRVFGGRFAGHSASVTSAAVDSGRLRVTAAVRDRGGARVARWRHSMRRDETGDLVAEQGLQVEPGRRLGRVAGAALTAVSAIPLPRRLSAPRDVLSLDAFVADYEAHLDAWRVASGVTRVETRADPDTGFFWAMRGDQDWASGQVLPQIVARLEEFASARNPVRRAAARRLLERIRAGERVTPYDVASRLGADAFAGLSWLGVRSLARVARSQVDVARHIGAAIAVRGVRGGVAQ